MAGVRPFNYHASAHALSGHLTRPENHLIQVQAGTSLPSMGGHHTSRVEKYRLGETLWFDSGYSHVSGSEKTENGKTIYTTLVTTAVEKLNILDMVTADRIVTRLASSYTPGDDEAHIITIGSRFENLRIAGYKIEVELLHDLDLQLDTFAAVRKEYEKNTNFRKMTADPFTPGKLPKKIEAHGAVRCSLVKELEPKTCPGITREGENGHRLVVREFGKIHLAEIQYQHSQKTLTMIRIELGSPNAGDVTVTQGSSNGRPPG